MRPNTQCVRLQNPVSHHYHSPKPEEKHTNFSLQCFFVAFKFYEGSSSKKKFYEVIEEQQKNLQSRIIMNCIAE